MIIAMCASGPVNDFALPVADYVIGVDRGAKTLLEKGYDVDLMIGDFDSVSELEFEALRQRISNYERVSPLKDETDTDLALAKAAKMGAEAVFITCVTGGRLDHQEAAMRSVQRFAQLYPETKFVIVTPKNEMQFLTAGTHAISRGPFKYISFFAVGETIEAVTLKGFKYETNAVVMEQQSSLFTSNEVVQDNATITLSNGICCVIRSED